ncbi:unnamed protein product [Chrysoparadoxa australica]
MARSGGFESKRAASTRAATGIPTHATGLPPVGLQSEYNTLAGTWVLNRAKSDAMLSYLQVMGVAPLAIEAQSKAEADFETRTVIALDANRFTVHKHSKINELTESYELRKERTFQCRSGTRRTTVALRDTSLGGVVVTSTMPTAQGQLHLMDVRAITDKGHTCMQELHATNLSTGAKCSIRRTWSRIATTDADRQRLMEELPSVALPHMIGREKNTAASAHAHAQAQAHAKAQAAAMARAQAQQAQAQAAAQGQPQFRPHQPQPQQTQAAPAPANPSHQPV